jgi:hypothetical protein
MKIILKNPLYLAIFGMTFPSNVEITVITYEGVKLMEHPKNKGILTSLPSNKEDYEVVSQNKIIKYFPIDGREDFFKYVIINGDGAIHKDWEKKEMYFEEFQLEQAERVLESINNVEQLNYEQK